MSKYVPIDNFTKHFMQPDSRWLKKRMDNETIQFLDDLKENILFFGIKSEYLPLCREKDKKVQIIAGHLRIRALIELATEEKLALPERNGKLCLQEGKYFKIIQVGDEKSRQLWLIDNIHRKELSPAEQFSAVEYFLELAGGTVSIAASMMKKSKNWISRRKMILESDLRKAVEKGQLSIRAAYNQLKTTREVSDEVFSTLIFNLDLPQFEAIYGEKIRVAGEKGDNLYIIESNDESIIKEINLTKSALTPTAREAMKAAKEEIKEQFASDDLPTSSLDSLVTDLEARPPTKKEVFPPTTKESLEQERKEVFKGEITRELFGPEEEPEKEIKCRFFGWKMDASDKLCANCDLELSEQCTAKTKENLKNGNVPLNYTKSIEDIGVTIAKLIHTMPHWQEALVMFAKQSWAGGKYDIKQVKLNEHNLKELRHFWKQFQKVAAKYSDDLVVMDRIDQYYQKWAHWRRDALKKLYGALLRVRLPRGLKGKTLKKITFEDLEFLQPCPKCFINGSDRNIWRWMPYQAKECSRHNNEKKKSKVTNRTGIVKKQEAAKVHTKPSSRECEVYIYRTINLSPEKVQEVFEDKWPVTARVELQKEPNYYRIYFSGKNIKLIEAIDQWIKQTNADLRSVVKDPNYVGSSPDVLLGTKPAKEEIGAEE